MDAGLTKVVQQSLWGEQHTDDGRLRDWSPIKWPVADGWQATVNDWFCSPDGERTAAFIRERLDQGVNIFPERPLRALEETALSDVKVVIVGQDPYHGVGQAEGLAFSVAPGVKLPPSLRNIFKELLLEKFIDEMPQTGSLIRWSRQGVLLLNTCLTVEETKPASHTKLGWGQLTDAVLTLVASTVPACVYMLWGAHAQEKAALIESSSAAAKTARLILQSNHPSPLSALRPPVPFLGNLHFLKAQAWLASKGQSIDWRL